MTGLIVCMGLYLAALIFARVVLNNGLERLNTEDKGRFLEITLSVRKWSLIFLVSIIVCFLLASRFGTFPFEALFGLYIAALLLFNNGVIVVMVLRKLRTAGMPELFIKKFVASSVIKFVAIILVAAGFLYLIKTQQFPL
jgi:hypothetical protein